MGSPLFAYFKMGSTKLCLLLVFFFLLPASLFQIHAGIIDCGFKICFVHRPFFPPFKNSHILK